MRSFSALLLAAGVPALAPALAPAVAHAQRLFSNGGAVAELPRAIVDTRAPAQSGRTITVRAGDDLQRALDDARPGDVVRLAAGAEFVGNFVLHARRVSKSPSVDSSGWIVVTSDGALPAAGTRLSLRDTTQLARIRTPNANAAIMTAPGAQGWRLVGLDVGASPQVTTVYWIVGFGDGSRAQTAATPMPSRLVLDRSYVHGHARLNVRRCVALNSAASAVIESYLSECHSNQGDSQAIYGWNGPGPFKIEDNYLEAGHEIVAFGGPTPAVTGLIPSDIEVRHNHFRRPLEWKGVWRVKNFFECKSCQRVLVEGNVMENNWVDGQNGYGILLQGLSDENSALQNRIWDVTIRNNIIQNTPSGINLASRLAYSGGPLPTDPATRITITNNVVLLNGAVSGPGRAMQMLNDLRDVSVVRNTFVDPSGMPMEGAFLFDTRPDMGPGSGLRVEGNLFGVSRAPVIGNGTPTALTTLPRYAPGASFTNNAFVAAPAAQLPPGNATPPSLVAAGLTRLDLREYGTTTGVGADWASLRAATAGVVRE